MAMTQTAVLALAGFATLATIGMFLDLEDADAMLVGVVAAVSWALVSLSSFNVLLPRHRNEAVTVELTPIVWLAAALALVTFLFTLRVILVSAKNEAENADFDAFN